MRVMTSDLLNDFIDEICSVEKNGVGQYLVYNLVLLESVSWFVFMLSQLGLIIWSFFFNSS